MKDLGYSNDLFMLPFDHRGSFQEKLFGIKGRAATPEETRTISSYKRIVYDGFDRAVKRGVPKDFAAILIDEQFGADIAKAALKEGYQVAMPVEKSSQDEFDLEYGGKFEDHVRAFNPTFVKVLVRYNPESDPGLNNRQLQRLKRVSDFCHRDGYKFIFELLVPATPDQLLRMGDTAVYDATLRPELMVRAMAEIQDFGVEPDIWKLEGIEDEIACRTVSLQARRGGRDYVGVIVLGRGESAEKVRRWLAVGARTPGVIGFAVGRTVFWDALKAVRSGEISRERAASQVADNYTSFCRLWLEARGRRAA